MTAVPYFMMLAAIGQTDANQLSLKEMQQRVDDCRVSLTNDKKSKPQLVATPIFHYSDEIRNIEDAGTWLWTDQGRPVAAMKVERIKPGVSLRPWQYCFTSLSSELVTAQWNGEPTFHASKPGITWKSLDDKPATTRVARLAQMREMARRFSAELRDAVNNQNLHQMRLLSRPLYRYEEGIAIAEDGAVFGLSGTGTNPDLLLLLDLTKDGTWQYGVAGMTAAAVTVRLNDDIVWQISSAGAGGHVLDNWTYFSPAK
jgi:hypothetical protein